MKILTKGDSFQKLLETLSGKKHKYYDRVTELANKYLALNTGENIAHLLRQFDLRETKEMFEQRCMITKSIVGAVSEKIMLPFFKLVRSTYVTKEVVYTDDNDKTRINNLNNKLDVFWGDESFDDYLESELPLIAFTDPNSFIVFERDIIDDDTIIRPFEVTSHDAVDFHYTNNSLDYLIVDKTWTEVNREWEKCDNEKERSEMDQWLEMHKQTIYTVEHIMVMEQIQEDNIPMDAEKVSSYEDAGENRESTYIQVDDKFYLIWVIETDCDEIVAIRVGYKRDPLTGRKTMVSPMHKAVNRMEKSIKSDSELDLTISLHTFPQKIQAVQRCTGKINAPCEKGKIKHTGKECSVCKGTGIITITSAQEMITVEMPTQDEIKNGAEMPDIEKILTYKSPPIDLVKFQDEYTRKLEKEAVKDVFVSEAFERGQVATTATEKLLDYDSVYDTLYPFGKKYSAIYKKGVRVSACYLSEGSTSKLIVRHSFPKDPKLKSVTQLVGDLEAAKTANAPQFMKNLIADDIAMKVFHDDKIALKKYNIKKQFMPFLGKSEQEVMAIINGGLSTKENITLYVEFENIFRELEDEAMSAEKPHLFYDLPYTDQLDLVNKKVAEIVQKKANESTAGLDLPIDPNPDDDPIEE